MKYQQVTPERQIFVPWYYTADYVADLARKYTEKLTQERRAFNLRCIHALRIKHRLGGSK